MDYVLLPGINKIPNRTANHRVHDCLFQALAMAGTANSGNRSEAKLADKIGWFAGRFDIRLGSFQ